MCLNYFSYLYCVFKLYSHVVFYKYSSAVSHSINGICIP
uniref:Uncharacterized protein n=1 Tax=Siphoviridae sp. ct3ka12 TaxID=2827771 RepID=A0A8S5SLG7_9CAUD|nr:MAG TPA: hypothetical protein [Siphoviridae sp. ct3ka12]